MRRTAIVILLTAIIGGIAWWLLHWNARSVAAVDPWAALPVSTAAVLEVPAPVSAWERFTSTSQLWAGWDSVAGCRAFNGLMERLHVLADKDARTRAALDRAPLLITWAPAADGFTVLALWPLPPDPSLRTSLGQAIGADLGPASAAWHGERVTFRPDSASAPWQLACDHGLLYASPDAAAIDEALTHATALADPALSTTQDSLFRAARSTLGAGSEAHLLVHLQRGLRVLNTWVAGPTLAPLEGLNGWAALDVRLRPEAVLLGGLLFTPRAPAMLRALGPTSQSRAGITRVLPPDVRGFWQLQVSDAQGSSTLLGTAGGQGALFDAYGSWVHGVIGVAERGQDSTQERWAVFQTDDAQRAGDALDTRSAGDRDTLSYRNVRFTQCADTASLAEVWGDALEAFEHPWWCVLNDKVVFSESVASLRSAVDAWTDGHALAQEPRAYDALQHYASEASFTWWSDAPRGLEALRTGLKDAGRQAIDLHRAGWSGFGSALVQLAPERAGVQQLTACITHAPGDAATTDGALWTASVGARITQGPYLLTDHLSRTQMVLVQDEKQRISLISCTGKVLWQREVDGPIMGSVPQVDRFKNGKLQMLFNTASRIYLIDRNGQDVTGFPITLPEKAACAVGVVDYDNTREYRLLVPTVEARVLDYGMDGKAVQGWDPPHTACTAAAPPMHLRIGNKDYLLLVGHDGQVTVLDRRGAPRYDPHLVLPRSAVPIGVRLAMDIGSVSLLWRDSLDNSLSGTLDGTVDTLMSAANTLSMTAASQGLQVFDADADGRPDVVLRKEEEVTPIKSTLAYPPLLNTVGAQGNAVVRDINADGVTDRVVAYPDGHVAVQRAGP